MLLYLDPIKVEDHDHRSEFKDSRSQDAANLVIVVFCRHLQIEGDVLDMIPPESSPSDQLRPPVSSSNHVELQEQDSSGTSSPVLRRTDRCVDCPCCCRQVRDARRDVDASLRRLVPLRAGITAAHRRSRRAASRRGGGTESIHTRRHSADRPTRSLPVDGEPALPGQVFCDLMF